jgi:hypothetical protein
LSRAVKRAHREHEKAERAAYEQHDAARNNGSAGDVEDDLAVDEDLVGDEEQ